MKKAIKAFRFSLDTIETAKNPVAVALSYRNLDEIGQRQFRKGFFTGARKFHSSEAAVHLWLLRVEAAAKHSPEESLIRLFGLPFALGYAVGIECSQTD